jgi:hypothetical protein
MKVTKAAIWITLMSPMFSSCGVLKLKKNEATKPTTAKPAIVEPPQLVGRIASIPADKRFVLIQSYGKWNVETGSILTTQGADNRAANLLATGESLGEFAAADLRSGTVILGDAVYSRPQPKSAELLTTPEVPKPQVTVKSQNVQKNN